MSAKILYFNFLIFFMAVAIVYFAGILFIENIQTYPAAAQDEEEKDDEPPIIYNVSHTDLTATSAVITWRTNEEADSLLNFGLDTRYGVMREPRFDKKEHVIYLEGLMPGTKYFYRITSSDQSGNQGISSDYTFLTAEIEEEIPKEGFADFETEEIIESGEGGLKEFITEEQDAIDKIVKLFESLQTEQAFEQVQEELTIRAEEEIAPPTIILDYADVEVGINYAIITWHTDKESNSIVALARENEFNPEREDPYVWREGNPEELVLEHQVYITGLTPSTVYHFQVSSESSLGLTGRSSDKTFKTKSVLPEIYNLQIIKIEEESATIRYMTNVPCSSIIEYTNLNTVESKLEGNSTFLTVHSIRLSNLVFDTYYSAVVRVKSEDGEEAESEPLTFLTTRDEFPPAIVKVNTESTIYPGSENKIQTIASWETDEPAQCQLFYHQGLILINEPQSLTKEADFGTRHVQVITNFLPSTVYKFWIICNDDAGNEARSEDYTMLTPSQEESIIDIILKNFESSFGWLKNMKM